MDGLSNDANGQLTQVQIYNRMQQAKLLGRHSNKFPAQMPEIKKRNATLSNLLRYPSPKSDKREHLLPSMMHMSAPTSPPKQPMSDLQSTDMESRAIVASAMDQATL